MPSWNKVVFLAISFAILIQLMALVWSVLAFVLKDHRQIQMFILIGLSVIICYLLAIVITNFATNDIATFDNKEKIGVGYSYYITCGGFFFSFITILFGIVAAKSAKKSGNEYTEDVYHW
uniref:Uncharacterized protein n=1 Tax=Panagrolaimus sp. ES5 TaxID=591445 RepID=A0AC34F9Z0_9BILA